jgi:hypothetical protein
LAIVSFYSQRASEKKKMPGTLRKNFRKLTMVDSYGGRQTAAAEQGPTVAFLLSV